MGELDDQAAAEAAIEEAGRRLYAHIAGEHVSTAPAGAVPEAFRASYVLAEPPVLTAALILAGQRPWWQPPITTVADLRRALLSGGGC